MFNNFKIIILLYNKVFKKISLKKYVWSFCMGWLQQMLLAYLEMLVAFCPYYRADDPRVIVTAHIDNS